MRTIFTTSQIANKDSLPTDKRRALMARVRTRDTAPEKLVRSVAHELGLRFRVCVTALPGSPDVVFPKYGIVIFVHGCFWHHHNCPRGTVPQTRTDFWLAKFEANKIRDRATKAQLKRLGWRVVEIWECETRRPQFLQRKLQRIFDL
jgi:DNA mismatch endonuclease (patch repair protein)